MKFCTFSAVKEGTEKRRAGVVKDGVVFELPSRPQMTDLFGLPPGRGFRTEGRGHPLDEVLLFAPIPRPGKIIATIVNTRGMLGGKDLSLGWPRLDMKAPSTVVGPGAEIKGPEGGIRPEVELAAIIGRQMAGATGREAAAGIFGYTILNDVTAPADSREDAYEAYRRDRATGEIRRTVLRGPLFRSKNHDSFCPMGPWIATPDENADWADLGMTTRFGDMLVQDGSTTEYIFGPAEIASYVSQFLTLEPGDVVSCGSVGWTKEALGGLDPTEFVLPARKGVLELEIEGVGKLRNPVTPG